MCASTPASSLRSAAAYFTNLGSSDCRRCNSAANICVEMELSFAPCFKSGFTGFALAEPIDFDLPDLVFLFFMS